MKFSFAGTLAIVVVAALLAALPCAAQSTPSAPPAQSPGTQPAHPSAPPTPPPGNVIFSCSTDDSGQTTSQTGPAAKTALPIASAPSAEDTDRRAVTVTALDLDIRLHTEAQQLTARALVTVRNTGTAPLARIPLQISSSLTWERIRIAAHDVTAPVATLNSDADHTGQLHEVAVPLAQPLAPGATLQLDVTYSGAIPATARRLLSIGTPEDAAIHSDWDQISPAFTGLRGFGNVVWYPVSSVPVILGDGARLYDEIGTQKLRLSGAAFRFRLTVEFPHAQPPTVALVNGHPVPLTVSDSPSPDIPGIATADFSTPALNFEAPSLFVATRTQHPTPGLNAFTSPEDDVAAKTWLDEAASVTPFLQRWLGQQPRTQLTLLDLPDPDDVPWESGPLLAIPIRDGPPDQLSSVLAHALTHAYMNPASAWLNEGTANFMGTLWDEHQHGRDKALAALESGRPALALAEPASPGESPGQPLATAIAPVYYRTKAAYILWMLRDLVGDEALSAAFAAHNSAPDSGATSFQLLLKQAAPRSDLSWFFADWIDADKGLPDLTISSVFPNAAQAGNWLVAVTISNTGYAAAEVPVTARSVSNTTTERVLVPARGQVTQRLLLQGQPSEVQVNDGTVPETQASIHITHLDQTPTPTP
jgi:hypothetical protein